MAKIIKFETKKEIKNNKPEIIPIPFTIRITGMILLFSLILTFAILESLDNILKPLVMNTFLLTVFYICIKQVIDTNRK